MSSVPPIPPRNTDRSTALMHADVLSETFPATYHAGTFGWLLREVFRSPDLRRVLPGLGLAALLYNLLGLAMALAMLQIMDRVVVNQSHETLLFLVIGAFAAVAIEHLMRALNGAVTGWVGARFEHRATLAALAHLMRVPLRTLQAEEPGVHIERVSAVAKVAEFYSGQALLVLFDLPFAPLFLITIALIGGWVVLVPIAILLAFVLVGSRFAIWMRDNVQRHHRMEDRRIGFLVEALSGIHSVKTMMMEAQMQRRYERLQAGNVDIGEALAYGNAMAASTGMVFAQIMTVGTIFASAIAVLSGHMTPGGLAACMTLAVRSLQPLRRALVVWLRYQTVMAARRRVQEIVELPTESAESHVQMPTLRDTLHLDEVTLKAKDGSPILQQASLTVHAGECIAIDGGSGSGKSSLLKLMAGLLRPDQGRVLADGHDLSGFEPGSVAHEIALLSQNGSLIAGTLLENLTLFDPSLEASALDVAQAVGLDRIVQEMKLGYETPLGKGNADTIALGTRQLISIVRALTCSPSVILFDEANTSLDMSSDRQLCDYLAQQRGQRTLVLVTHRPSLMALATKVYHIADGRLLEGPAPDKTQPSVSSDVVQDISRPAASMDSAALIAAHFPHPSDLSACLWPLLNALGWSGSGRELKEALPHAEHALDLSMLCNAMSNLGWRPEFIDADAASLDARLMPCLCLPRDQPAVVLIGRNADGELQLKHATDGRDTAVSAPVGIARMVCFKPMEKTVNPAAGSWFERLGRRFRRHVVTAFLLTLASTALSLTAPLFVRTVYDHVLPTGDLMAGGMLLIGAALAIALDAHLRHVKSRLIAHVGGRSEFILGTTVFRTVIGLPFPQLENVPVNRQISRLRSFEAIREFFLGPLTVIAFELPANITILLAIAIMNPWALAVIGASTALYTLLFLATRGALSRAVTAQSLASTARWEFLNETITQMDLVRISGRSEAWLERFREVSGKAVHSAYRQNQLNARVSAAAQVLGSLTGLAALGVSTLLSFNGAITTGTLVATAMLVWRLTGPLQSFFLAISALPRIRGSMRQIENLVKLPPEGDSGVRQTVRPPSTASTLTFSRVSFRYAADADPTLLGVQFSVKPGQVAVIVGNNGSGKSSLFKLITRAHTPQAGTILMDSLDIRQMTIADLRGRIAYMPQDHDIFYGTVAQNLRLVHPTASDAEVQWAMEMAGLASQVSALPAGLETRISGSRSENLPNGFRQRLALARVMLKPAPLVLLDEPTTGLDDAGVEALERCVAWLRGRSTVLMISHRPSHMRLADTVVLMNRGSVVAAGAFDQVKERISTGILS